MLKWGHTMIKTGTNSSSISANSVTQAPVRAFSAASSSAAPSRFKPRPIVAAIQASVIGLGLGLGLACASAQAADIIVTSNRDDNGEGCTLREAIVTANNTANLGNGCGVGGEGRDLITFDYNTFAGGNNTITLQNGDLELVGLDVELNASNISGGITLDANRQSRAMLINGGRVDINRLNFTKGRLIGESIAYETRFDFQGAGLMIYGGAVVNLSQIEVRDNINITSGSNEGGGGIRIDGSDVVLNQSLVSNNLASGDSDGPTVTGEGIATGGGILLSNGSLEVNDSEISSNSLYGDGDGTNRGSGVFSFKAELTISNSTVTGNTGGGSVSASRSSLEIIDTKITHNLTRAVSVYLSDSTEKPSIIRGSTISHNQQGATVFVRRRSGTLNPDVVDVLIEDSTLSYNRLTDAAHDPTFTGTVLQAYKARLDIHNSTISNNTIRGSVASTRLGGYLYLNNVTIADNQSDGIQDPTQFPYFEPNALSIGVFMGSATIKNSIISNPALGGGSGTECLILGSPPLVNSGGEIIVDDATIVRDDSCGATRTGNPGLLPLANNGGATLTHALAPDSIAIDTGDTATCLAADQRGAPRDAQCDVGAFEFGASAASINLLIDVNEVAENGGTTIGTLTRTGSLDQALTVTLQSSDVTSVTVPSSVQLPADQATALFDINAIDDLIAEGNQEITITASADDFVDSSANVTVTDDDIAALTLSLARAEAAENSGTVVATLSRNTPTDVDLTVALSSNDVNSATVPASVTIPAGSASANLDITLLDTLIAEGDRVINIAATADGLLASNAELTVTDDEVPSLSVTVSADSVAENAGPVSATLSRNTPITEPLQVSLTSSNAARLGVPATTTIAAGDSSVTVELTPVDDQIANGDSVVTLSANATGLQSGQGELTVIDNEIAALSLDLSANSLDEGGSITATLSRNTPTQNSLTVALTSSDASRLSVPAEVTIAAGETTVQFEVTAADNALVDGNAELNVTASVLGLLDGAANLTVTDNDLPTLTLSVPNANIAENSGTVTATLTRNTPNNTAPLTVALVSSAPDRLSVPATANFADGALSTTVELSIADDNIALGDLVADLSATADGFVSAELSLTVVDNEQPSVTLSFAQTTVTEGGVLVGTVTRNTQTDTPLLVSLSSSDADVASVAASIEIAAGATSADVIVSAIDNTQIDPERVVTISANVADATVTGGLNGEGSVDFSGDSADLTVLDNDDTDADGIANVNDNCPNNANADQANLDQDSLGDACDADIDGDGMPNTFEQANGLNPRNAADANQDNDGDGFTNVQEFEFGTNPNVANADENNNGIPDAAEAKKFNVAPILLLLLDDDEAQ